MEHTIELQENKTTYKPKYLYSYKNLTTHLETCITVIAPTIDILPSFKEHYTPCNIMDYYDKLKRNYELKLKAWRNRGNLWKN